MSREKLSKLDIDITDITETDLKEMKLRSCEILKRMKDKGLIEESQQLEHLIEILWGMIDSLDDQLENANQLVIVLHEKFRELEKQGLHLQQGILQ